MASVWRRGEWLYHIEREDAFVAWLRAADAADIYLDWCEVQYGGDCRDEADVIAHSGDGK